MAINTLRNWFRNPLFLLALAAGLIAFAVQSGELGTSDTEHRLQSTHAFWTCGAACFSRRLSGIWSAWPQRQVAELVWHRPITADVTGGRSSNVRRTASGFAGYNGNDPSVRNIIVSYSTNVLIAVLTALVCFRFLRQLNFGVRQSVAGVLALLLLTTHLHYTQNMMENNYICLLTLAGLSFQYEWLRTGDRRALLIGSCAFGLNLLTRLTTGMDLLAGGPLCCCWRCGWKGCAAERFGYAAAAISATALPVYAFFGLLDRIYQFYRFGSFFNTYMSVTARETMQRIPTLPANYPFDTPFHVGFFGALFAPEKSIFLFDPLLILMILCAPWPGSGSARPLRRMQSPAACCCWPISVFTRDIQYGAAIPPGANATFQPRLNWQRCWLFRCCCGIAGT